MNEKKKANQDDNWLKEMPVRSESLGFAAEEMLECDKCGRTNPPNRLKCFYCAAELAVTAKNLAAAKPNLRRLENWEKGFNVIVYRSSDIRGSLAAVAGETGLEREMVEKIFSASAEIPIARVESEREAELLGLRLKNHGIETQIVPDEALSVEVVQRRIRGLEFQSDGMTVTDFNTREIFQIPASDLVLVVTGILFELKTASFERRKRKKTEVLDQSETSSDEAVLDLYTRQHDFGFRIYESGFDFSCLGSDKSLFASENMPKLTERLIETCPNAKLDVGYADLQDVLATVWEVESQKDFKGLSRSGFGKADLANVVTVNNRTQFNRYSRLRRHLI